jgi:hypothetical protein
MMIEFCRVLFFMNSINWSDNQCVAVLCKKKKDGTNLCLEALLAITPLVP